MNEAISAEYLPYLSLAIGLFAIIVALFLKSKKSKLKETGILVDGIVFKQEFDNRSSHSFDFTSTTAKDKISIRFVTLEQQWITGTIEQEFQVFYSGQYRDGEIVKVYYEGNNPSNFYVDTKQSEQFGRIIIAIVGLIFGLFGLYKLLM